MQFFPLVNAQDQFLPVMDGSLCQGKASDGAFEELFVAAVSSADRDVQSSEMNRVNSARTGPTRLQDDCLPKENIPLDEHLDEEDFSALKNVLTQYGISKEKIELLQKKFEDDDLDWKAVFSVLGMNQLCFRPDLDKNSELALGSALQKLGFTPQKARELIGELRQNKKMLVWKEIARQLEKLPGDKKIIFSQNEINALQKAFKSKADSKEGHDIWHNFARKELSLEEVRNLLALLKKSDSFPAEGEVSGTEKEIGLFHAISSIAEGKEVKRAGKDIEREERIRTGKEELKHKVGQQHAEKVDKEKAGKKHADFDGNAEKDTDLFKDMLVSKKIKKKEAVKTRHSDGSDFKEKMQKAGEGGVWAQERMSHDDVVQPGAQEKISRQIMEQVESGIFRTLKQGVKELKVQLTPPDLGRLNVVLQVKNNEVTALIKTTNQDVTRIIADNMQGLKDALEKQGLQVSKLDVQTQLPDNQMNTPWQGAQQHNQAHEHFRQSINLARLRGLTQSGEINLAQEMQHIEYRENISLTGVDVFA